MIRTLSYDVVQPEWSHQILSKCTTGQHEYSAQNIHTYQFLKWETKQKQKQNKYIKLISSYGRFQIVALEKTYVYPQSHSVLPQFHLLLCAYTTHYCCQSPIDCLRSIRIHRNLFEFFAEHDTVCLCETKEHWHLINWPIIISMVKIRKKKTKTKQKKQRRYSEWIFLEKPILLSFRLMPTNTYTGGYRRQNNKQSIKIAGIQWNSIQQMLWCKRLLFIEPPGYQTTPFSGNLLQIIQRPQSINSFHETLISAELTKW